MTFEPGDIGKEICEEYEAICLALDAIGYMLRKTKDAAFIMHITQVGNPGMPAVSDQILNMAISGCRATLRDSRQRLGEILERVGADRNATDAVTPEEAQITSQAFLKMYALAAPSVPPKQPIAQ